MGYTALLLQLQFRLHSTVLIELTWLISKLTSPGLGPRTSGEPNPQKLHTISVTRCINIRKEIDN